MNDKIYYNGIGKVGFEKLMIEGCIEMAEESLKITKEFEAIDEDFDWEWNGKL